MRFTLSPRRFALIQTVLALAHTVYAQSDPTATQQLQLSAFVAGTDTYTNLSGGKNSEITAGADVTFPVFRQLRPSIEIRGTYPTDRGQISSHKDFLLGPKLEYPYGRLVPYVDLFVGRGKINYYGPGFIFGNRMYISSTTVVYSPGVGLDCRLSHSLAVKTDLQFQHWNSPATASGAINPTAITFGVVYTFDFNQRHHPHGR